MGKISLSSILGLILGFGLIYFAIQSSTDNVNTFFSLSSLCLVLGGTLASAMISFDGRYVFRAFRDIFFIFIPSHVSPKGLKEDVGTLLLWSQQFKAKQNLSLRELEEMFFAYEDPDNNFTQLAIGYLLANYQGKHLAQILNNLVASSFDRDQVQVRVLRNMGDIAPAFGMAGTIIGIMIMLANLQNDLSSLGQGMALCLLTTLYGLMLSQLIFKPAARKLEQKNEMRRFRNQLLSQGFLMLSEKRSTLDIQDNLNSFLAPANHFDIAQERRKRDG